MGTRRSGVCKGIIASAAFADALAVFCALAVDLDPSLPTYTPVSGISSNLRSIGPNTVNDPMDSLLSELLRGSRDNA
jgi:hypothetical protein